MSRYNFIMLNFIGVYAAIATFLGVWLGHVSVRRIEFRARNLLPPILTALALGLCAEIFSLLTNNRALSAAAGILGLTFLWDAFEFIRQERRVRRGHAPANPRNPRHARILQESPTATTFDWLKREPRGQAYSADELRAIAEANR